MVNSGLKDPSKINLKTNGEIQIDDGLWLNHDWWAWQNFVQNLENFKAFRNKLKGNLQGVPMNLHGFSLIGKLFTKHGKVDLCLSCQGPYTLKGVRRGLGIVFLLVFKNQRSWEFPKKQFSL